MSQTKIVEKRKIHILCSVTISRNRDVCEITWKNFVKPDKPQLITWRMRNSR